MVETDVRPGGSSFFLMRGPECQELCKRGVYLEVMSDRKQVFTGAYPRAWMPSTKPFMTCVITFEDEAGKMGYTAHALRWSEADRTEHEKMGFHEGWGRATDQLGAFVMGLWVTINERVFGMRAVKLTGCLYGAQPLARIQMSVREPLWHDVLLQNRGLARFTRAARPFPNFRP